ncbi:hypothetical protein E2C01_090373 [Portunus trituberculatus]|uniref:Uncharacterized protein n=1 Tax=Portunus trituberculatus TaxID=210409 RepID=A0A5B7JS20_PORTR|nr:hypothetical protein [Portunus trituberculatus]
MQLYNGAATRPHARGVKSHKRERKEMHAGGKEDSGGDGEGWRKETNTCITSEPDDASPRTPPSTHCSFVTVESTRWWW